MISQNTFEPMEFFCTNCGEKVTYSATLCPNCGSVLSNIDIKYSKELIRGRTILRIIMGSSFTVILIGNILSVIITNRQPSIGALTTLVLTSLLYICFYKGFTFAKWLTIFFLGVGGIYGIKFGISIITKAWFAFIPIIIGLIYVVFSIILIKSNSIKLFQNFQWKIRQKKDGNYTFWIMIILTIMNRI